MTSFARIDHAAGAMKVGKALRPTEVSIFGNPQGGTPFMECNQTVGIDLPLKALVWQDAAGQVWLGYTDPVYLAERHGVPHAPWQRICATRWPALPKPLRPRDRVVRTTSTMIQKGSCRRLG